MVIVKSKGGDVGLDYEQQDNELGPEIPREPVQYGSFWSRFAAHIIDSLIVGIPIGIISVIIIVMMVSGSVEMTDLMSDPTMLEYDRELTDAEAFAVLGFILGVGILCSIIGLVITWIYYAVLHSSKWQATLGNKLLGLKVTDLHGQRISFGRATGRFFSKSILSGILLIGYIIAAFTERKQALHDMIAGTLVIKD